MSSCSLGLRCPYLTAATLQCGLVLAAGGRMTLAEIAEHEGLTRERIRQIAAVALRKARKRAKLIGVEFELPAMAGETVWEGLERDLW